MADHDHSYKQLFSHAALVRDLLQGFVREAWIDDLDLSTLEKMQSSYISDDLREREDDAIWRVRCRDEWIYVYILMEFQSTVDRFMAVRLMTYIGLLYQDLIRGDQLLENGKLPPVFPLVLYNGKSPWNSAISVQELIQEIPGGLSKYRPALTYLLLDESRHPMQGVAADNLVAAIFRLEQSNEPADVRALVQQLIEWLKAPEQTSLRRAFAVWIRRVLLPVRLPGQSLPEINNLVEVDAMLAERVKEWTYEWKQEGIQEGMQEGMQKGMQEGIQEGMQKGMQKGMQEGEQKGEQKGEAGILLRLMCLKFGELDAAIIDRIQSADIKQLTAWSERIFSAKTVEKIFVDVVNG